MGYYHLATYERKGIEILNTLIYSKGKIALLLRRYRSSIDKEMKRNNTTDRDKEFACYHSVNNNLGVFFALLTLIHHSCEVAMKILTFYFESSIRRKPTLPLVKQDKLTRNLFLVNSSQENLWNGM